MNLRVCKIIKVKRDYKKSAARSSLFSQFFFSFIFYGLHPAESRRAGMGPGLSGPESVRWHHKDEMQKFLNRSPL